MLTLVTMDEGHRSPSCSVPSRTRQWERVADEIRDSDQVLAVVTAR